MAFWTRSRRSIAIIRQDDGTVVFGLRAGYPDVVDDLAG